MIRNNTNVAWLAVAVLAVAGCSSDTKTATFTPSMDSGTGGSAGGGTGGTGGKGTGGKGNGGTAGGGAGGASLDAGSGGTTEASTPDGSSLDSGTGGAATEAGSGDTGAGGTLGTGGAGTGGTGTGGTAGAGGTGTGGTGTGGTGTGGSGAGGTAGAGGTGTGGTGTGGAGTGGTGTGGTTTDAGPHKRVFITNDKWTGNLKGSAATGLEGADALCQTAAASLGGTWIAWLSDSSTNAIDRIADVGPWYRVDGVKAFENKAALKNPPLAAVNISETGATVNFLPWTGTKGNGTADAATCNDWTSALVTDSGLCGLSSSTTGVGWTESSGLPCSIPYNLYCFEQ